MSAASTDSLGFVCALVLLFLFCLFVSTVVIISREIPVELSLLLIFLPHHQDLQTIETLFYST